MPKYKQFKPHKRLATALLFFLFLIVWAPLSINAQSADTSAAYVDRGNLKYHQGDFAGAIGAYGRAIELNPAHAEAYNNRGLARFHQGDAAGAVSDFNRAIELDPEYADAYNNRGVAGYARRDYDGAIADYDRAIVLYPEYAEAFTNRGIAKHAQGDFKPAMADHNRSIDLNPEDADAFNNRGITRSVQGDFAGAIADYTRATSLDPKHADAYNNLGYVYEKNGEFEEAIKSYQKALQHNAHLKIAQQNLEDLFNVLTANPEFISKMQSILAGEEYYSGKIDGVYGPMVRKAVRAFQKELGLDQTGIIDSQTHHALVSEKLGSIAENKQKMAIPEDGSVTGMFNVKFPPDNFQTADSEIPLDARFVGHTPIDKIAMRVNYGKFKGQTAIDYSSDRTTASIDYRIPLVAGRNQITMIAFTGGKPVKKTVTVVHNPPPPGAAPKGEKWAVVIGIEDYDDPAMSDLDFSVDDAEDITRILIRDYRFPRKNICLLTDRQHIAIDGIIRKKPTSENLRQALFTDLKKRNRDDTVVVYYSGHGVLVPDPTSPLGMVAHLAPSDFKRDSPEVHGIELDKVKRRAYLPPERMFLIIDSCFSGGGHVGVKSVALPGIKFKSSDVGITSGFAQMGKGRVLLSSCLDNQVSLEAEALGNSVFTYYLVEILATENRLSNVFDYVHKNVLEYTQNNQEPRADAIGLLGRILLF